MTTSVFLGISLFKTFFDIDQKSSLYFLKLPKLKQHLLLFDKIEICDLERGRFSQEVYSEIEWLKDAGLIETFNFPNKVEELDSLLKRVFSIEDGNEYIKKHVEFTKALGAITNLFVIQNELLSEKKSDFLEKYVVDAGNPLNRNKDEYRKDYFEILREKSKEKNLINEARAYLNALDEYKLLLYALWKSQTSNVNALPITSFSALNSNLPYTKKSTTAQIAIRNLPFPNNQTPWEQIIDYRNDPDNKARLAALRRWIRRISTEALSVKEIEDEFGWLLSEFERSMKIYKMKTNTETIETIVKAPLEILEDLVTLKFSKIPDPFFAIKKREIFLMEAELISEGRELSFIINSQQTFLD